MVTTVFHTSQAERAKLTVYRKKEETLTNLALETKINYLIRILMDFICFDQLKKLLNELINLTEFTSQSYSGVCLLAFNANPGKRVTVQ